MSITFSKLGNRLDMHRVWLCVALVLGSILRLAGLDRQGFWTDELYVVWEGRQPLDVLLNPQLHIQHPPGYRLLLHVWMGVRLDEVWIRAVPAISGILLIPAVWVLGRMLWPSRLIAGDAAALLVATSPYLLHYSQDVTSYSWTTLCVTVSFILLVMAWRGRANSEQKGLRLWLWAAWSVSLAVSLYSHYFALFPLVAEALAVAVAGLRGGVEDRKKVLYAGAAICWAILLYAPWAWTLFMAGGEALGIHLFPLSVDGQVLKWVPLLGAGYAHPSLWQSGWVAVVVWTIVAAGLGWAGWRLSRLHDRRGTLGFGLAVTWLVAGVAGPYLFLRVTSPPDAVDPVRFGTMAVPALLLGVAGVVALARPAWRLLLLACWLLLAGWQWRSELLSPPAQDWRGVMSAVHESAAAGDVMLAFPAFHAGAAASYYPPGVPVRGGWFVREGADPAGAGYWFPPEWQWNGFLSTGAVRSADMPGEIAARTGNAGRIWYLAGDGVDDGTYTPSPTAERALAGLGWKMEKEWRISPLVLKLYVRSASGCRVRNSGCVWPAER